MTTKYINLFDRTVIAVSGADAYKLLQGIISNDLSKCTEDSAIYSYLLTPQGKYLFDFFISKKADKYFIEVAANLKDEFLKKLKMYKLRSDVLIEDMSATLDVFSLSTQQPGSYKDPRNDNMSYRILLEKGQKPEGSEADISEYHALRITNNIPEGEYDLERDKSYPLQYRMNETNAVDYKKGCYVGQEVTARTQHRGAIRKTVYRISSTEGLEKGADIQANAVGVGKVLSVADGQVLAMIEIEKTSLPLTINGKNIEVIQN